MRVGGERERRPGGLAWVYLVWVLGKLNGRREDGGEDILRGTEVVMYKDITCLYDFRAWHLQGKSGRQYWENPKRLLFLFH